MKLLIVDDEKLTREGIRRSLDLEALSIDSVILADDGVNGLEAALTFIFSKDRWLSGFCHIEQCLQRDWHLVVE